MQQNVVAPEGATVPVGVPSIAVHVPPLGGTVMVAFAEVMLGFPEMARNCSESRVKICVSQLGGGVRWDYGLYCTVHLAPVDGPQVHAVQLRVSVVPE